MAGILLLVGILAAIAILSSHVSLIATNRKPVVRWLSPAKGRRLSFSKTHRHNTHEKRDCDQFALSLWRGRSKGGPSAGIHGQGSQVY